MNINENSIQDIFNEQNTRRDFILNNIKKIGIVSLGVYTISYLNSCSSDSNPAAPQGNSNAVVTLDITQAANAPLKTIGGTVAINGNDLDNSGMLIVRQSETGILAFSRTCTHQGCTVPNFQNGISTCPCHGSQYNTSGNVVTGPAPAPLKKYKAVLAGNIITITA